ncbi:anaerobic ribonucleoside-triphosphate reductase [Marinitoga piezophila KA3]|uniref:Anaerobic ribonucleoside-triphosphate reductase n=1 Tax=Marinitoga piezophila (strain DSM 14283 / JCM 11233 / KA3) TaxID=443254 RepID=H2J670_MARPK|nr:MULTISPECIES: ribonucleoside triphosphate reductase [Marinitoga]AEX85131.1 anaerobic ribonucleoside-triphosphate reductase [Marinitoga piezophila KA3]APT75632.1 ribonucleoside-triphosphate reductase [Marinitoga sp. 1137]NUU97275.1 ribonucleoside-triphosphate reductase [Marinitoga sp. 1138]
MNLIYDYLENRDWKVRENSNMQYSLQGLNNHIHQEITKEFWLNEVYDKYNKKISEYHKRGFMHIHDLGALSAYCVGWDLEDLLRRGFNGVPGKVASGPARHFRTALGQIVNFLYTMQGEAAGAVAFSNFDTLLAPFIKYDNLSYEQVKQAMQEFIFNMNVPTRVGFQSPFSNITMDLTVPSTHKDKHVIIGGKEREETYSEFQIEMDMINKAFIEVMLEGDYDGRPFSFPIPTYNITKDFNWDSEVATMIMTMTMKYGTPYFANYINSDMNPEDARSMCCRLKLDNRQVINHMKELSFGFVNADKGEKEETEVKRRGGLFGSNPLTGSIGVVTVNMPRLMYLSNGNKEKFYSLLDDVMNIAKESLEIKRQYVEEWTKQGLYPYTKVYLDNVYQLTGQYWANHFSTIGFVGMHEGLLNFGIEDGIVNPEGKKFAEEIMNYMLDRLNEFNKETGNLYNLEASPAEGTTYRLAKIDLNEFKDIKHAGTEENPYYTNSVHPPVNYFEDPFDLLEHQEGLQNKWTGGTVIHIFVGEKITDGEALKEFIRIAFENHSLPYMSITPTFSICPDHGYIAGEHFECPYCGKKTEVYSRVVGYYRPVQNWNDGKQQEYMERIQFRLNKEIIRG